MDVDRLLTGDCRALLRSFPDGCFALAIIDGPYNLRKAEWDKFPSWEAFVEFYRPLMAELARVLRDNSSFYLFGTFEGLAALKPMLDELDVFRFGSLITHHKGPVWKQVNNSQQRCWPNCSEHIAHYVRERVDISSLAWDGVTREDNTIRAYLDGERRRAGVTLDEVREAVGCRPGSGLPGHWFGHSQWMLPTKQHYEELRHLFNARGNGSGEYLRRDYEYLRRDYEELRRDYEELRYPFNPQKGMTDVWEFGICQGNERLKEDGKTAHVAQKPLAMMEAIVRASSNEGDLVLDPFCGAGTIPLACANLGRRYVGMDIEQHWVDVSEKRLAEAARQRNLRLPLEAP